MDSLHVKLKTRIWMQVIYLGGDLKNGEGARQRRGKTIQKYVRCNTARPLEAGRMHPTLFH